MKQRIVIRVQLKCQKCRSKAMMIAAKSSGTLYICVCEHNSLLPAWTTQSVTEMKFGNNDPRSSLTSGVTSVALQGEKCNQIVVIGEAVDAAGLTSLIRKKVGNASLELVHAVESAE